MKVLFIRSGNSGTDPISTRQGESLRKAGVDVSYYDISGKGFYGYLKNVPAIRQLIRRQGIDLIHAHYGLCGLTASLCCSGKRTVTSLMGSDVLGSGPFMLFMIRFFARYFWDVTIVKTPGMQKRLGLKSIRVIPNGIDMNLFRPHDKDESVKSTGWDPASRHILFCADPGRREKNYVLAEKALTRAREKYRGRSLEVHFLTGIDQDKVADYYCAADLLLVTSFHEGSSNTVKEAMACNCPVVATDVGDIRQIISGTEGCYITTFEPEDIAEAILAALNFGKRTDGRSRVAHLDSDEIAKQIAGIYKDLVRSE